VGGPFVDSVDPRSIAEYPNFSHTLADRPQAHRNYRDWHLERGMTAREWKDWPPVLARCYEQAHLVDAAMGRVLDALDGLGLAENTLVLYTADHGDMIAAQGGMFDKGYLMVEETERIPLAVRWPGRVPAGAVSDALVTNMDLVPTALEAAGAEVPSPMDGRSVLRLVQSPKETDWPDDVMCTHHGHGTPCFQRMLRWGKHKYVAHLADVDELYDLEADSYELANRIDDPAMKDVLAEMRSRLLGWMDRHEDTEPDALKLREEMR
jgi:arylsulfatase A-like enzyme